MAGMGGIEAYDFIEHGTFDSDRFIQFIEEKCVPVILPGDIGLIDNASIHSTAESKEALDMAFDEDWTFCPTYSPRLKPIERIFGLIKGYLRDHEIEALLDPEGWIIKAFERYSCTGSHGHVVKNFWNVYYYNQINHA